LSAESVTLLAVGYIYGGIWAPPPTGLSPVRTKASFAAPPHTGPAEAWLAPASVLGQGRRFMIDEACASVFVAAAE
ncbi:MAG: hypothetical protein ACLQDV_30170, partial [Candidatus Binataceae bacterium]